MPGRGCHGRPPLARESRAGDAERNAMSPVGRTVLFAAVAALAAAEASAQVVYYPAYRPVVAAPVFATPVVAAPAYVANYVPAGNYAAVTAFSPPVAVAAPAVAVRSYYAPAYAPVAAAPVVTTSYYAPAATTAYYAPPVAEAVVAAPVTAYYAPAVAAPLYRRGLFGGYRPVRTAYYIPY